MGRRRIRPRIESDLIRFNVHHIVTNKDGARHFYNDELGRHTLIDEIIRGEYRLVAYLNRRRTDVSFPIEEIDQAHLMPEGQRGIYFIRHQNKRHRYVYFNPETKEWGTAESLRARYTIESISPRRKPAWRQLRNAKKLKTYKQVLVVTGPRSVRPW